jgi:hypothetical protein
MKPTKIFKGITWGLSLFFFVPLFLFGILILIQGYTDWWQFILAAFASFAGVWWVYLLVKLRSLILLVLWLGIITAVLMCIFPPWTKVICLPDSNIKAYAPLDRLDYRELWNPPYQAQIDFSRLFLQLLAVSLITGGLIYTIWLYQNKKQRSNSG